MMNISQLSNEQKLKNWKRLHEMKAQGTAQGDFAKVNFAKKLIAELQPFYNEFSTPTTTTAAPVQRPSSTDQNTESRQGDSTVEPPAADTSTRFSFYMTAVPSNRLDQLCHAIFAKWLTFRGFKRQSSAERLADYRQMITCILCNLAYSGTVRVSRDKADFARAVSHYRPSVFNKRFLAVLDNLHEMGVLVQTKGQRYKTNYAAVFGVSKAKYMTQDSILTRLTAGSVITDQLKSVTSEDVIIETETQEVVVLRRDEGSELVEYSETPRTLKYRRQVKLVNEALAHAGSSCPLKAQPGSTVA